MIEHKIYRDGKPVEYRIIIGDTKYTYYPGRSSVFAKTKSLGIPPSEVTLDLESGQVYTSRSPQIISSEWKLIRDKFKAFN